MICELTAQEFDKFAINHVIASYYQSSNYANLMSKFGYEIKYIGYKNKHGELQAATLLLIKKIAHLFKYAYAPKGFLVDYKNEKLLSDFTKNIIKYASSQKFVFIKINPEIPIYRYNLDYKKRKLSNYNLIEKLENLGYLHLRNNIYFESMQPRFNAILDLNKYATKNFSKTNRNKIQNASRKGLEIEVLKSESNIKDLYKFIEHKKKRRDLSYYKNYFSLFNKDDYADIFLVKINYNKYLENSKNILEKEEETNQKLTERLFKNNNVVNIKRKMDSDRKLQSYKNDVINATYNINRDPNRYIAGAFCIRYLNRVHIVISGYNEIYGSLNPNYFLHNEIFKYYKNNFDYIDLNGITGDFSDNNPYKGLNKFKLGFNPYIYEFIGEFDLVINKRIYELLISTNLLQKEFKKD